MRRKEKTMIIFSIIGVILGLSGITYAYLRTRNEQKDKNIITTLTCLNVSLENIKEGIKLENAYSITDEEGEKEVPYTFVIKNNCAMDVNININLESLKIEGNKLASNQLKVKLNSIDEEINEKKLLSNFTETTPTISTAESSNKLSSYYLAGGDSKTFELRLWIDENVTWEEGKNKGYEGKIVIISSPTGVSPVTMEYDNKTNNIAISKVLPQSDPVLSKTFKVIGNAENIGSKKVIIYKVKIKNEDNTYEGLGLSYSLNGTNITQKGIIMPNISKEYIGKDDIYLGEGIIEGGTKVEHEYTIKFTLNNIGLLDSEVISSIFNGKLEIEYNIVSKEPKGWDEAGSGTLLAGIKENYPTIMQPLTNPGKEGSPANEAVLAGAVDDYGMSYYFRGNVTNNYVQFANKCWRIVRVTGDGTIKLVLHNDNVNKVASPCASSNNTSTAAFARYSGTTYETKYNEQTNDNAYVGFKYGTAGSNKYAETHANINKSTILQNLETWYKNNLASYESKLADTIWCNDKSTKTNQTITSTSLNTTTNKLNKSSDNYPGLGYGTNKTIYSGRKRVKPNYDYKDTSGEIYGPVGTGPTLICPLDNNGGKLSKLTVSDTINGNGALDYKIGLLTVDEVLYAGSIDWYGYNALNYNNSSIHSYLRENATSSWYWSFSPYNFRGEASVHRVGGSGYVSSGWVALALGLRPAVSLTSATTISGGNGTSSNPFVIN